MRLTIEMFGEYPSQSNLRGRRVTTLRNLLKFGDYDKVVLEVFLGQVGNTLPQVTSGDLSWRQ